MSVLRGVLNVSPGLSPGGALLLLVPDPVLDLVDQMINMFRVKVVTRVLVVALGCGVEVGRLHRGNPWSSR